MRDTFAHIRLASHFAFMLRAFGINPPTEVEETVWFPFGRIGYDLVKKVVQASGLKRY
jgi:hypothetical protein